MSQDPHPSTVSVGYRGAHELAADLEAGTTTSVEVVRALLERIGAIDADLRAVVATAADALEQAERLDSERAAGTVRSPLHGVPVVVKDNVEAIGLPATAGSLALEGRTVERDAPLVARMREAGLVVIASTNLSEWANLRSSHSTSGWSGVRGLTGNPWALDRSAGGSSSGSGAAVAAGYAPLAIGTETDGSIVCPASLNGVVGIKPTVGRVPAQHVVPISASQDSPGPMARSVLDTALLLDVLAGSSEHAAAVGELEVGGVRVGVVPEWLTGHGVTDALFADVVERLRTAGATVVDIAPVEAPGVDLDELTVLLCEFVDDLTAYLAGRPGEGVRSMADVVAFNRQHPEELAFFDQDFLEMALASGGRASADYAPARARCLHWAVDQVLAPALAQGVDVLVGPTYAPAWKSDLALGDHPGAGGAISSAPAIAGWPILCVPMGLADGLPVGLGLTGRPGTEPHLLAVGHVVETLLDLGPAHRPAWTPPHRG
ncbi:MAG: amidase family protein [Candidatus Nanopelagicales bacterium]